jgi:hypothetical protein
MGRPVRLSDDSLHGCILRQVGAGRIPERWNAPEVIQRRRCQSKRFPERIYNNVYAGLVGWWVGTE